MHALSVFVTIAGFVIGLGAVTVIDLHGFLARTSAYWTEATIRTHKVTKPLIWAGIIIVMAGHVLMYAAGVIPLESLHRALLIGVVLVVNGCFLSFVVSPRLVAEERDGRSRELVPASLQRRITASFVVSFAGWWSLVYLCAAGLAS